MNHHGKEERYSDRLLCKRANLLGFCRDCAVAPNKTIETSFFRGQVQNEPPHIFPPLCVFGNAMPNSPCHLDDDTSYCCSGELLQCVLIGNAIPYQHLHV